MSGRGDCARWSERVALPPELQRGEGGQGGEGGEGAMGEETQAPGDAGDDAGTTV
jgi:hypothetical protein